MKARIRYLLVGSWLLILLLLIAWRSIDFRLGNYENFPSYISEQKLFNRNSRQSSIWLQSTSECSMANCFDISRCLAQNEFRVYVYPDKNDTAMSLVYANILKVIRESSYFTEDPDKACLFVLSIDTIDRDRRSENYVRNVNQLIASLPAEIWNFGRNHIIFNLYHGTYPNYSDHDLGFDVGYAIIARASANAQMFRDGFDLSFPLFHKQHPLRTTFETEWSISLVDRHLVSFKGKRYVYGIGSETRDSLYHLHNGHSVVMVTTCKHNTDWKKYEDGRCENDNVEYDRWNYDQLISNSTFCLTPRGRRLGSFRFLEALKGGCIPVIMSNDWELPFSEVIDWRQAVIFGHENTVVIISDELRSIPLHQVLFMKQQARGLYQRYFSSIDTIVRTTLEIIEGRINRQRGMQSEHWNDVYPFMSSTKPKKCIVLLRASMRISGRLSRIIKLLTNIDKIQKIIIFWPSSRGVPPDYSRFSKFGQNIIVYAGDFEVHYDLLNLTQVIQHELIGDNVLLIDERVEFSLKEILLMFDAAEMEPERLYGFYSAYYEVHKNAIEVTIAEKFSMILSHFALLKTQHLSKFWKWISNPALEISKLVPQCFTILLNIMLTEITLRPPVLIGDKVHDKWMITGNYTACLKKLIPNVWTSGPVLLSSSTRISSLLSENINANHDHKRVTNEES